VAVSKFKNWFISLDPFVVRVGSQSNRVLDSEENVELFGHFKFYRLTGHVSEPVVDFFVRDLLRIFSVQE